MIDKKDINFFKKNGYIIKRTNDQTSLNKLQDFVYKILSQKKQNSTRDKKEYFTSLHKQIKKKEICLYKYLMIQNQCYLCILIFMPVKVHLK